MESPVRSSLIVGRLIPIAMLAMIWPVACGVYLYRMEVGEVRKLGKIVVLR